MEQQNRSAVTGRGPITVRVLPDSEAVTAAAAKTLAEWLRADVERKGRAVVALSGGSTPRNLFSVLASAPYEGQVPWESVHLIWGDERCVPPDHPDSNYGMAAGTGLLDRPFAAFHRMPGELDPEEGASRYEEILRGLGGGGELPLDIALNGMGEDGHTASLFPGSSGLDEGERWVVATEEHGAHRRLTLTLPAFRQARRILFLVTGAGKAQAAHRVLAECDEALPSTRVMLLGPQVRWLLDRDAAGELDGKAAELPLC